MPASKKPRKTYSPKWNTGGVLLRSEPWKIAGVFSPVESILGELERDGTVLSDQDGVPIFRDRVDGSLYEMGPSIRGLTDAFDVHSARNGRPVTTNGLAVLCLKLELGREITPADISAARRSVVAMRDEAAHMTSTYASRLVRDVQIKFELEAAARRRERHDARPTA